MLKSYFSLDLGWHPFCPISYRWPVRRCNCTAVAVCHHFRSPESCELARAAWICTLGSWSAQWRWQGGPKDEVGSRWVSPTASWWSEPAFPPSWLQRKDAARRRKSSECGCSDNAADSLQRWGIGTWNSECEMWKVKVQGSNKAVVGKRAHIRGKFELPTTIK